MDAKQALTVLWEATCSVRLTMKENEIVRLAYETLKAKVDPPPETKEDK